jgi:hypothetical protein
MNEFIPVESHFIILILIDLDSFCLWGAPLRFQYVLAAATSIATKVNEESLTYLNQGQPYEIKMKKLGDLSNFRGKLLRVSCVCIILMIYLTID